MFVILREGNDAGLKKKVTYQELLKQICKFSNVLKNFGIRKGVFRSVWLRLFPQRIFDHQLIDRTPAQDEDDCEVLT